MSTDSEPPPLRIRVYSDLEAPAPLRRQIEEILLASANPRRVPDESSRTAFLDRWLTPYLTVYPEQVLLALDEAEGGQVLGVLNGCLDSAGAEVFRDLHPYYRLFADLYQAYPAHFHVNCHPDHRGRGVGSCLVEAFVALCRDGGLPGVHLVTAPGLRNVGFYRRNGFTEAVERSEAGQGYLFLGRRLAED